jgi:hypothetical protein
MIDEYTQEAYEDYPLRSTEEEEYENERKK